MATEQALVAAIPGEAAPVVDADHLAQQQDSESVLSSLLDQMSAPAPVEAAGEDGAESIDSPAAEADPDPEADSSFVAESVETETSQAGGDVDPGDHSTNPNARNFRGRWDHLDEQERRVVELTTKRGLSLKEAYRAVYGDAAPEAGEQQAGAAVAADGDAAAVDAEVPHAGGSAPDLEAIVAEVARQMGLKPGKPVSKAAAPSPRRTARPVATGGSVPPTPSFDTQARQALASNNPEALLAAMREGGTKFEDLLRASA